MSKYPVLSVIAVQKPEINTGMSRSSVQEVITWTWIWNHWNERGNWFTPKMHAVFYINWTNNLWKNKNIYYRVFRHPLLSSTMPGKGRSSPWWNHFQVVNGDFRLVQCIHCNKLVRRGKAGCSSQATSNSGMATHIWGQDIEIKPSR